MIPVDDLDQLARERYDLDTGQCRADEHTRPLTDLERAGMLAWIAQHEDPIRADRSDVFISGMFLGARRRHAALVDLERQLKEQDERRARERADRAAIAERDRLAREAKAARDYAQGLADGERHARERAEANASMAEVRIAARAKYTADDSGDGGKVLRPARWRK